MIHTQILKFHDAFRGAKSLDEMVQLQNDQYVPPSPCCVDHVHRSVAASTSSKAAVFSNAM